MKEKDTTIGQAPIRDARTLGAPRMLVLGLQHMFAMFGATVLVPILVQSYGLPLSTQTTLFFAGFGTLFFHLCTKLEIPAFLGSSFAFLGGFSAMANLDTGKYAAMAPGEKLQYACGGIVVAGLLYVILALVVKVVGSPSGDALFAPGGHRPHHHSHRAEPGPLGGFQCLHLLVAGAGLHGDHCGCQHLGPWHGEDHSHSVGGCGGLCGSPAGRHGRLHRPVRQHPCWGERTPSWACSPSLPIFSGSVAKFDLSAILVMAPIAVASMMEHIGDISAISATVGGELH